MIWSEELAASLDQSAQVVVFHHEELSRAQQLALTLAERASVLVEQNEKTLDTKQGTGVWGERGADTKGEKRGEVAGERKGREGRARGATRGKPFLR